MYGHSAIHGRALSLPGGANAVLKGARCLAQSWDSVPLCKALHERSLQRSQAGQAQVSITFLEVPVWPVPLAGSLSADCLIGAPVTPQSSAVSLVLVCPSVNPSCDRPSPIFSLECLRGPSKGLKSRGLKTYRSSQLRRQVSLHIPGHKRGARVHPALLALLGPSALTHDLTELKGGALAPP